MRLTLIEPDYFMVVPDYHPAYGLADTTRARVLCLVRVDKLPVKQAAAKYRLHPTTINRWLRATTLTPNKDL